MKAGKFIYKRRRISLLFTGLFFFSSPIINAQVSLVPGISVKKLAAIEPMAVRIVYDEFSSSLYYSTAEGNIYRLDNESGKYIGILEFTAKDHGIEYLMGFVAKDEYFYLAGNNGSQTPYTTGIVVRGTRKSTGTIIWNTVVRTAPYETAGDFDHMLSGLAVSPGGDSLFFSNGSRGDHGEVGTRNGLFPGLRNTPLTTKIFCVPSTSRDLVLPYDSAWLANSPYLYASGVRNFFDMAFSPEGELFALENSGDRDHNEELNWLRKGKHYGFPWVMGETPNPLQFSGYDIQQDKLLPVNSYGRQLGLFYNDSNFPPPPKGLAFSEPVINMGPDADLFRDTADGLIYDAGVLGFGLKTFTAHRSPLGLVFDNRHILGQPYTGDGFMLSYSKGLDSSESFFPNNMAGPFLDESEDLIHLEFYKDESIDNYRVYSTRIVGGFSSPVDAELVGNRIYVIESKWSSGAHLYEVTLPVANETGTLPVIFPNPGTGKGFIRINPRTSRLTLFIYNITGEEVSRFELKALPHITQDISFNAASLSAGSYFFRIADGAEVYRMLFQKVE